MRRYITALCCWLWFGSIPLWAKTQTFKDDRGRDVVVDTDAKKIVSLVVGTDEILWDVIDQRSRILATSFMSKDPAYSNIYQDMQQRKIFAGDRMEDLIKLQPDLVLAASYTRPEIIQQLEAARIPVYVQTHFHSWNDLVQNIKTIGILTNCLSRAEQLIKQAQDKMQALPAPSQQKTVLNYDSHSILFGENTLFDAMVSLAHAQNGARSLHIKNWQAAHDEQLMRLRPDMVVIMAESNRDIVMARVQKQPIWEKIPAVKQKRFVVIPSRQLEATSHHFADAVVLMYRQIYGQ